MSKHSALLTLLFGLGVSAVLAVPAVPAGDQAKIAQLVSQLGSDNYRQRDAATRELDAIGEPALEALRKAAKSSDMEVANRANTLVAKIEHRTENARLIAPTYVELNFKETPVEEAVAELAKKSGYLITIAGDKSKLADRRVSLETGKVAFWKALDLLCEKAGLVESDGKVDGQPLSVPPYGAPAIPIQPIQIQPIQIQPPVKPINIRPIQKPVENENRRKPDVPEGFSADQPAPVKEAPVKKQAVQPALQPAPAVPPAQHVGRPVVRPRPGVNPQAIVLVDGASKAVPSHVEGAIRIRIADKSGLANFGPVAEGELLLGLDVRAEPKIQVQQLLGVKIDKAQDNYDQLLTPVMVSQNTGNEPQQFQAQIIINGQIAQPAIARPAIAGPYPAPAGFGNGVVPFRLKKSEKEPKSFKEIRGAVSMKIRTPLEELVVAENVLKAKGDTIKGKGESQMKIVGAAKEENGDVKVEVELQFSHEVQPNFQNQPVIGPGVRIQIAPAQGANPPQGGGFALPAMVVHNHLGLELIDVKGQPIPLVQSQMTKNQWLGNGRSTTATLTFRPGKDQEAAKLVFKATRLTMVDVPFVLKDVAVK